AGVPFQHHHRAVARLRDPRLPDLGDPDQLVGPDMGSLQFAATSDGTKVSRDAAQGLARTPADRRRHPRRDGEGPHAHEAPRMTDISKLYSERFPESDHAGRQRIWQALCEGFFDDLVGADATVLDIACGYGEFINAVR